VFPPRTGVGCLPLLEVLPQGLVSVILLSVKFVPVLSTFLFRYWLAKKIHSGSNECEFGTGTGNISQITN
jgi:antibiotic biosynthesis monooxygenase (ABM) superfamily enzyme